MKLKSILETISAKYMYRLSYLANNYRDPFLRQVENEIGLTRPELTILFCLAQKDGINAKDVADLTRQPKNTLSRGAEILERKGLITRRTDERDRRRSIMHITEQGLECYDRMRVFYEEAEQRMLAPLNRKDLADLDRVFAKMCNFVAEQNGSD